ncbi:hypothetical protein [Deferrisoma sp.]
MADRSWWSAYRIPAGTAGRWRIGALTLWAERRPEEWLLAARSTHDPHDDAVEIEVPTTDPFPDEGAEQGRYPARSLGDELRLDPCLPDRPVVSRPAVPLYLAPGEKARLYVSVPVWVRVKAGAVALREVPIYRSSDTWFGPNTREGELAYAARTSARTRAEEVPRRPHRAVVPVDLVNRTKALVPVERLNLPVVYLPLFGADDGNLWTPSLDLRMEGDGEEEPRIQMDIRRAPPSEVPRPVAIAPARETPDRNLLTRALSALIG